ncbi:hypothetical protein MAPG_09106 [Magnaporthiopsis poae ATCC 64411]|uniref:Uncharacterized protein n=1 Tax=Magnaporthiopsis poae (strain ATCC 64411 / 73-15) TaxID=644358 RepID=A0A0C4E929_MAGP6|nr:hypothetical protein MAPG_09106 [Magnaporthiopsis poae ATCC 64411]
MVQLKSLVFLLPLLSVAAALPAGEPPTTHVAATGSDASTFDQDTLAQLLAADADASSSFSASDLERRNWLTNLFKKKKKPINKQDISKPVPPPPPPPPPAPFHGPSSDWKKQGLEIVVPPGKKPQKRNWLTNLFKKKKKPAVNKQDISKPVIPPSPPPQAPFHGPSSDWKKQGLENIKKKKPAVNKQDISKPIPPPPPPPPPAPFHGPSSDWKKQGLENIVPPGKKPGQ